MKKIATLLITTIVLISGCSSEKKEPSADSTNKAGTNQDSKKSSVGSSTTTKDFKLEYTPSDIEQPLDAAPEIVGGIKYITSSKWTRVSLSGDKLFEYSLGPLEKDAEPATMLVSFQPSDKALTVDENKELWFDQMLLPGNRDPRTGSIEYTLDVDSMKIHVLSIFGSYKIPGTDKGMSKVPYRFVGAIVEAPRGVVLFRLVGPDYTARIMIEAFIPMIKRIVKAG